MAVMDAHSMEKVHKRETTFPVVDSLIVVEKRKFIALVSSVMTVMRFLIS